MTNLVQVVTVIFATQYLQTRGTPIFQGISFKQDFDISLKPFQFKPFSIIKEKWSPFGAFRKKHGIQRRQVSETTGIGPMNGALPTLEEKSPVRASLPVQPTPKTDPISSGDERIVPVRAPPVFEKSEPMPIGPFNVPPSIRSAIPPQNVPPNVVQPIIPESIPLQNKPVAVPVSPLSAAPLPRVPLIVPPEISIAVPVKPLVGIPPVSSMSSPSSLIPAVLPPVSSQPISPNIGNSVQPLPPVPVSRLLTDIYRDPAENLLHPIGPTANKVVPIDTNSLLETPKPQQESTFARASRFALNFSQIFVQLMNQFFTSARASINQFSNPLPVYRT